MKYLEQAGFAQDSVACIVVVDGMKNFIQAQSESQDYFEEFFSWSEVTNKYGFEKADMEEFKHENEGNCEIAHCFLQRYPCRDSEIALNLVWCVKQTSKGKLNTHMWVFEGFCELVQPDYCLLMDMGVKPHPKALLKLYTALECDSDLGGCCGEIEPSNSGVWNFYVSAQKTEYKLFDVFDRSMESLVGYVPSLPVRFSAYRWKAVKDPEVRNKYFESIKEPEVVDVSFSNICLSEDRALSYWIVMNENAKWTTKCVRGSVAEVELPEKLADLVLERRTKINGKIFATLRAFTHIGKVFKTKHSVFRKFFLFLLLVFNMANVMLEWLLVGLVYGFLVMILNEAEKELDLEIVSIVRSFVMLVYVCLVIVCFIISIGVNLKRIETTLRVISILFGIYMGTCVALLIWFIDNETADQVWIEYLALASIIGLPLNVLFHGAFLTVAKGILQFTFSIPTYVNVILVYATCNVHRCQLPQDKEKLEAFGEFRARWMILWLLSNYFLGFGIQVLEETYNQEDTHDTYWIVYSIFIAFGITHLVKFLGGVLYVLRQKLCRKKLKSASESSNTKPKNAKLLINELENISVRLKEPSNSNEPKDTCVKELLEKFNMDLERVKKLTGISQKKLMRFFNEQETPSPEEESLLRSLL
eukprot:CAMPEP_0202437014 /NCGR_PEP_ID=MMETSP1345-20130828/27313_1 /ASSEMBLY_ACC=CAM_ASM_000843 /TAXON_ID=342563 /ORGANISM="Fabrea Fabrea salina" /LENGTH=644 /DNA_ID=CAMNT_0049050613 /DNA_START=148 /DNA_END=2082 /DNA_ORIENTATION=+